MECLAFFVFNDTATTEIYTLSLHDALPILLIEAVNTIEHGPYLFARTPETLDFIRSVERENVSFQFDFYHLQRMERSEEHTSELQSRQYLVCRLLLEKTEPNALRRGPRHQR